MRLLPHVKQKCPKGCYHDEWATADEDVFKPYTVVNFTGPNAPFVWNGGRIVPRYRNEPR